MECLHKLDIYPILIQSTRNHTDKASNQPLIDRLRKLYMSAQKEQRELFNNVNKILKSKYALILSLAEELLVKETLDVRSIQKILGKRPFPPNKTF